MLRSSGTNIPRSPFVSPLVILRRFIGFKGLMLLGLLYVSMAGVCGGNVSPFLAAQFAQNTIGTNLPNRPSPPPTTTPSDDNGGNNGNLTSVCNLDPVARTIQVVLQNQAQQPVQFVMTFVVSAGPGGFVCDAELQNYLNAGYADAVPPGQTAEQIGCDTVNLLTGTRLLTLQFGIDQNQILAANVNGAGANTTLALTTRTNNLNIPVPELIVFGNSNPQFICTGTDLCTQRGFVYVSAANLPIGKPVEAYRIQGTLCETGFGTAPEWRLDKTINNTVLAYQYVGGSTIIVDVLDRSGDTLQVNRNQVVWTVTDADSQNVIHEPNPGGG